MDSGNGIVAWDTFMNLSNIWLRGYEDTLSEKPRVVANDNIFTHIDFGLRLRLRSYAPELRMLKEKIEKSWGRTNADKAWEVTY